MFGLQAQAARLAAGIMIVSALAAAGGVGAWRAAAALDGMVERAVARAVAERDSRWRAQIAEANAQAERERASAGELAAAAEVRAQAEIGRLSSQIANMGRKNAKLPGGRACGLDGERSRLLNRAR